MRTAPAISASIRSSSSKGQGTIDRSEKLRLSVAAIVNEVLPNGNVVISGSQEVRVNFEVRVLNIAGIVRPRDISPKNTISYDKIAEARVSYGGRGRLMEVAAAGLRAAALRHRDALLAESSRTRVPWPRL